MMCQLRHPGTWHPMMYIITICAQGRRAHGFWLVRYMARRLLIHACLSRSGGRVLCICVCFCFCICWSNVLSYPAAFSILHPTSYIIFLPRHSHSFTCRRHLDHPPPGKAGSSCIFATHDSAILHMNPACPLPYTRAAPQSLPNQHRCDS